jgi:hypothetical protein
VLDRERGQVRVGREVAGRAEGAEQLAQNRSVTVRRIQNDRGRLGEPCVDDVERLVGVKRPPESRDA